MGVTSHFSPELFDREELWASSIAIKLREANRPDLASSLEQCHQHLVHRICRGCHTDHPSPNHCDRFYCPLCIGRLAWHRRRRIEWWARQVKEPKHIVLTVRNTNTLTKKYVQRFKRSLNRLRRCKLFRGVRGGLQSLEVTNEGRGWHLHAHLLVDVDYIPAPHLAQAWSRQVQQDFAIVKIKDCRDQSYLGEVTKYAVKGSALSSWDAWEIVTFIDAFTGVKTFSTFGSLFKDNAVRQRALLELEAPSVICPKCGSEDYWFLDDSEFDYYSATGKLPWQSAI